MPNTLVHLGIQGIATRAAVPSADARWIAAGAVLPDFPWIVQRLAAGLPISDPYQLRAYFVVQASLLFCLIASAALAAIARRPAFVGAVLAMGSVMHLLLDALQTKWANGVHLAVPWDWHLLSFDLFWPESALCFVLTGTVIIAVAMLWRSALSAHTVLVVTPLRACVTIGLTVIYVFAPLTYVDASIEADNHYLYTLKAKSERPGKVIEIDRTSYLPENGGVLQIFTGERFRVTGLSAEQPRTVSIRGIFETPNRIRVTDYHVHTAFRDVATYFGLVLAMLAWVPTVIASLRRGR